MQDTGPVLQRLQMEAYRAVLRAMAVAPLQYVSRAICAFHSLAVPACRVATYQLWNMQDQMSACVQNC